MTACFACNRGKAAIPLAVVPESLADRAARIAESEEQLAGYREILRDHEARKETDIWDVIEVLYGETSTTHERFNGVKRFLERLPYEEVMEAARIARANMSHYGQVRKFKYFCAVCWNKIGPPDE